jgi:GNAT superfamily N-acetyltransferase
VVIKENDMRIRPAGHGDIAPITAIVNAAYSIYIPLIGKPPGPMLDDYAAHVRAHAVWVAEADAGIAGLIVLLPETDHLLLDNVAVDPARHGQGVGRALMRFAEVEARRRGFSELRLYTHEKMTENVALYARSGWTETGRGEQLGYSRVFFSKRL